MDILTQNTIFEISNKADYQAPTPASTALFQAALAGSEHGVKEAIKAGGKVNYFHRPEDKTCALHVAAENGSAGVVDILIECGALIDAVAVTNQDTPLVLAAGAGHAKIVETLLAKGANPNHANGYGNSSLHQAAKAHNVDVCASLLKAGAKIDIKNKKGSTPLLLACLMEDNSNKSEMMRLFKLLVDNAADVNAVDNNGSTPLHAAAGAGNEALIEYLLSAGANAKAKDSGDFTPLRTAEFHKAKISSGLTAKLA